MKLISVKILGNDFRSLANNKLFEFNVNQRKDRLSTKIFAGLNGSGKSNFLELLAKIFFYPEKFHLKTVSEVERKGNDIGFEIEYLLPIDSLVVGSGSYMFENRDCHVRIRKPVDDYPEFSFKKYSNDEFIRMDNDTFILLPTKIVAYTSGQNELLSNPFLKIRYNYFKEIQKKQSPEPIDPADNERLFFLDSSSNFSIFVSNMLLADPDNCNI